MRVRRAAAALLCLLAIAPTLAACGGDEAIATGDVVPARSDDQFVDGSKSHLVLPMGRLEVFVADPVTHVDSSATRQFEALDAPDGSTFVPITWQYNPSAFRGYSDYLGADQSPAVDLKADGATYRLPAPADAGEGSESFYVLVTGSGKELGLEVDFDGVVQTLDLLTGERDPGQAKPLYSLKPRSDSTRSCNAAAKVGPPKGLPTFACTVTRTGRLPYAAGEWAKPGRSWLVVSVTTTLRRFDVYGSTPAEGAIYNPGIVESEFRLGKQAPASAVLDPDTTICPDLQRGGCMTTSHLVFDVPKKAPDRLTVRQTYPLKIATVWGGFESEDELEVPVRTTIPLR